jgi:hypothetical protein
LTSIVIVAGLVTFVAALGVGLLALSATGARPSSPWREVVALLLGVAVESTLVQALTIASFATRRADRALDLAHDGDALRPAARCALPGEHVRRERDRSPDRPLIAVALGVTPRERFLERYVALYDDWRALDTTLPRDALILDDIGRTSLLYAPRPVLVDARDLASEEDRERAYVLGFSCGKREEGPVIYTNSSAVVATYRTPWRGARLGAICVRKLVR